MSYTEQFDKLTVATSKLPPSAISVVENDNLVFTIEGIADVVGLTMREIGEVCELVRQIITKERQPKDFEAGLTEKIDEDNREKIPQIVSLISEKIFSKLLPALGIKIPIELSVQTAPPKVEGLEVVDSVLSQPLPSRLPPKRMAPPPPSSSWGQTTVPPPVVRGATFSSTYAPPPSNLPTGETDSRFGGMKPPIMETSHTQMSEKPIESLLRMLDGRVSEKEMVQQYEKLPLKLKEALRSVDSAKKVVDIGRKYALHVDKIGELGAETGMVILGFTHPGQFLPHLSRRLGLSEEKVKLVAQEINTEVFLKIREALKQIHEETVPPTPSSPIPIKPVAQVASTKPAPNLGGTDSGEVPDRATILRDIENPKPLWFRDNKATPASAQTTPAQGPSLPVPMKPKTGIPVSDSFADVSPRTPTFTKGGVQVGEDGGFKSLPASESGTLDDVSSRTSTFNKGEFQTTTSSSSEPSSSDAVKPGVQAQDTPWQPGTLPKPPEPVIQRGALGQKLDSLRSVPPPVMSEKPLPSAPIMSPKITTPPVAQPAIQKPISTAIPVQGVSAKNILDQKLSSVVTSNKPGVGQNSDPYREPM